MSLRDIRPSGQWPKARIALPVAPVGLPRLVLAAPGWYTVAEAGAAAARWKATGHEGWYQIDPAATSSDATMRVIAGYVQIR